MFYTFRHLVHDTATALPVLCDRRVEKHRNPELWRLISVELSSPMHADPKDAVNIFLDTKCKKAIGMHWVRFFCFSPTSFCFMVFIPTFSPTPLLHLTSPHFVSTIPFVHHTAECAKQMKQSTDGKETPQPALKVEGI
jgi:hypothetical protein